MFNASRCREETPMTTFADLGVPEKILSTLKRGGITDPFPIQKMTIPDGLAGRDILGRAPTGSGKTLAFGIPVLARVGSARPRHPEALILAPTRELAAQIEDELKPLAIASNRWILSVYGGVGYENQRRRLSRGVDVLIACPGRLEDLIDQNAVNLSKVATVVVDEADRMADMGFMPAVRRILDGVDQGAQTILFSATLDGDVSEIIRRYQENPVRHEVADQQVDVDKLAHHFWKVEHPERVGVTAEVVGRTGPTVVFVRTRHGADRVAKQLARRGVSTAPLHGQRSQSQRDRALREFRNGRVHALVATDVAARGIHVDDVACVIHFDPPENHKTYLHRSGRTARAGASGVVLSLVQGNQTKDAKRIQRQLGLSVGVHQANPGVFGDRVVFAEAPATPTKNRGPNQRNGRNQTRGKRRDRGRSQSRSRNNGRSAKSSRGGKQHRKG
ncbi:MAG: DEAD/DEAH box helicase, partial [Acidimicrobiia bacterium]|nr:DEAD/DEAH box helicase [Acidimicrobiia bacterium]